MRQLMRSWVTAGGGAMGWLYAKAEWRGLLWVFVVSSVFLLLPSCTHSQGRRVASGSAWWCPEREAYLIEQYAVARARVAAPSGPLPVRDGKSVVSWKWEGNVGLNEEVVDASIRAQGLHVVISLGDGTEHKGYLDLATGGLAFPVRWSYRARIADKDGNLWRAIARRRDLFLVPEDREGMGGDDAAGNPEKR